MPKGVWPRPPLEERFWAKVDRWDPDHCWEWTGARNAGYGRIRAGGDNRLAHRIGYELLVGPIPDGLTLDHLCCNPGCVNPRHLEPTTAGVNAMRGNGMAARHARKTHCVHGHRFDAANTYHKPGRPHQRHCRTCQVQRDKGRWRG